MKHKLYEINICGCDKKHCKMFILNMRFTLLFLFFQISFSYAQLDSTKKIIAKFDTIPVTLKEGDIIAKTLFIVNKTNSVLEFSVDINAPADWRSLTNRTRKFSLEPLDSIFIPVRIIPIGKTKGNTKYMINAYVVNKEGTPVSAATFYVIRTKYNSWDVITNTNQKVYFKNNEYEVPFSAGIINTGNDDLDVLMELTNFRKDFSITDSTGIIIKKPLYEFKLKPGRDSVMQFRARNSAGIRHFKLIDLESHRPNTVKETQNYSLYIKSSEPVLKGSTRIQKTKKIDFVRLGDQFKVNPYSYTALPLILDANIYNILGTQPLLNIMFRGNTILPNGAALSYNSQFFFSTPYYSDQYLQSGMFNIGYYTQKYGVEFGEVGLGTLGGGRGLSGFYQIQPNLRVGGFVSVGPTIFGRKDFISAGLNSSFSYNRFKISATYSHRSNTPQKLETDYLSSNVSYRINNNHSVTVGASTQINNSKLAINSFTRTGIQLNGGYAGNFQLKDSKLNSSITGSYTSKYFTPYDAGRSYTIAHFSNFSSKKSSWNFFLSNLYTNREYIPVFSTLLNSKLSSLNNSLNASHKIGDYFMGTGAFYNYVNSDGKALHSRGLNLNVGKYNYESNTLISSTMLAGYTRYTFLNPVKDYFFFQFNTLYRYRVLSINFRYAYGTVAGFNFANNFLFGSTNPQYFSVAFNYQYQFRDPHFLLQNPTTYTYQSTTGNHSLTYSPEFYYYTDNGWRLKLVTAFYLTKTNPQNNFNDLYGFSSNNNGNEPPKTLFLDYNISLGVRKEFGIPIPFVKTKFYNTDFIAFVDINGNGKRDDGEFLLENIVIKMDKWEVLTNEQGRASIKNAPLNTYNIEAFSLDEIAEGFFPNIPDQVSIDRNRTGDSLMYIPFVKGIKIFGKVLVDRDKVNSVTGALVDVSGIKISAINGKTINGLTERDGSFQLYVPYGKYKLHLDEKILGEKFTLLQNDIELQLDKRTENLFVTFYIIEKKRKIIRKRVGPNGEIIDEESNAPANLNPSSGNDLASKAPDYLTGANDVAGSNSSDPAIQAARKLFLSKTQDVSNLTGLTYTMQLGAFQKPINPTVFNGLTNLLSEQLDNNFIRISAGKLTSWAEAQAELINLHKVGFTDAFISAYYNGKQISVSEAQKIQNSKK